MPGSPARRGSKSKSLGYRDSVRTMGLWDTISKQLSHPSGFGGRIVAGLMNRGNAGMNAAAIERLALEPGDKVLDLGFGGGAALAALRDTGANVTGVDRATDMVVAARKAHPDMTFAEGGVDDLPFGDGAFEAVLSVNTVYFWPDLPTALTEVRRVLAPGGRLALGIRDPEVMTRVSREVFTIRAPAEVADAARAAGFSGVQLESPEGERVHFVSATA